MHMFMTFKDAYRVGMYNRKEWILQVNGIKMCPTAETWAVDVNTRMLAITVIDELWFTVTMLMIDMLLSGVRCISYVCVSLDSGCVIYWHNSWCVTVIERAVNGP